MSKTITFTDEEIEVLRIYLGLNPCESCCAIDNPPKGDDCYAVRPDRSFMCPLQRLSCSIESKLDE